MSAPHFVFVHGTFGRGSNWDRTRAQLHQQIDCTSSVLDLPGHAARPLKANHNAFEQLTDALRDEVVQPSIIVGYSLGGRIALHAALNAVPELPIRALVLEGANPGIDAPHARSRRAQLDAQRAEEIEREGLRAFLDRWYRLPLFGFDEHDDATRETLVKDRAAHKDPSSIARILRDASPGRVPSLWPKLRELSIPLAFVHGAKDERYATIGERLQQVCPQTQLHSIAHAGHNAHDEDPDAFAEIVANFAQGVD